MVFEIASELKNKSPKSRSSSTSRSPSSKKDHVFTLISSQLPEEEMAKQTQSVLVGTGINKNRDDFQ